MNLPIELPIFPLGSVLFPGAQMPLHIFEPRYRKLMRDQDGAEPIFGVILTESGLEVGDEPTIHSVGTAARLLAGEELQDGRWAILIEGTRRFRVMDSHWDRTYMVGRIEWLDGLEPEATSRDDTGRLIQAFVAFLRSVGEDAIDPAAIDGIEQGLSRAFTDDLDGLTYLIAGQLPLNSWSRQRILEMPSLAERSRAVRQLIRQERAILDRAGATAGLTTHPAMTILPN